MHAALSYLVVVVVSTGSALLGSPLRGAVSAPPSVTSSSWQTVGGSALSAYVSIRQHTLRQHTLQTVGDTTGSAWSSYVSIRQHTLRQHTLQTVGDTTGSALSSYVSIRQHTSAYAAACDSIRQHTCDNRQRLLA